MTSPGGTSRACGFYDLVFFVITDLCKIPLTMTLENCFPPVVVKEAPEADAGDHVLAFGCVDLGYAYVRDTKENVRAAVDAEEWWGRRAERQRGRGCVGFSSLIGGVEARWGMLASV